MNKHCFKIIFSHIRQCIVVVSELARLQGKSRERISVNTSGLILQKICKIRPLVVFTVHSVLY